MITTTSIGIIAVAAVTIISALIVTTVRTEPGERLAWLLDSAVYVFVVAFTFALLVGVIEMQGAVQQVRDREAAQIDAIEGRYDVEVTRAAFGKPGDWKIDDAWVRCFVPDEAAAPADVTLSCDPTSNTATEYVDFADLN